MQENIISIKNKKGEIIDVIKNTQIKISNKYLMVDILDNGRLDDIVKKVTKDEIIALKSPLLTKGYLTGYEQFVSVLDNFISYILNYVNSPELIKEIIIQCLINSDILLSKRYYFDVENIEYYKYHFNIIITKSFYKNLIILKDELKEELKNININLELININNKNDVTKLIIFIDELTFINRNDYKLLSLFIEIEDDKYDLYIDWYKMILSKYIKNIAFIKEYSKYKYSLLQ